MEETKKNIQKPGIITGLVTSACLISYFMLMKVLGLAQVSELRYFNFVILLIGIVYVFRHFKRAGHNIAYLPGLGLGMVTTAASVIPFAAFLYIYFSHLDPALFDAIKNGQTMMGEYLTPFGVAGAIVIEGICFGGILSFAIMQYYKSGFDKHTQIWWDRRKGAFVNRGINSQKNSEE